MNLLRKALDPVGLFFSGLQFGGGAMAVWTGKHGFWYWTSFWAIFAIYFIVKEAVMQELDRREA
jgi:hypothetical protein